MSAVRTVVVICDSESPAPCPVKLITAASALAAGLRIARANGWGYVDGLDLCPHHLEQAKS